MMRATNEPRWWEVYSNIVTLVSYMRDEPAYTKDDLAYAVEKPWKYEPEARHAGIETGDEEVQS